MVWLGVIFFYSLHLSLILHFSTMEAVSAVLKIWVPFALTICIYSMVKQLYATGHRTHPKPWRVNYILLRKKLKIWFRVWIVVTIFEVIVSGGVPLVWALTGSSKSYVNFGISSLHGLVNSLQVSIAICYFVLYLITQNYRDLKIPAFLLCWSVIIINRNMMLVTLLEFAILYVRIKRLRTTTIVKLVSGILVLVVAFGVIGDIRQGSSAMIRDLAQPSDDYPEWLPSGALWAYIYITTPINNLIFNIQETHPIDNPLFPNTVATLFPTVIRVVIYGDQVGDAESGQLVTSAFNVSTAYIGPFQDFGFIGTTLFSVMIALTCIFFWFRNDLKGILMFAVLSQCLVLTLFFDHFFYLPVITQLGWLWYFFLPRLRYRFFALPQRNAAPACVQGKV